MPLVRSPEITDAPQIARTMNDSWRVGYRGLLSDAILDAFEKGHKHVHGLISVQRDEELSETIRFPVGPGKLVEVPKIQALWTMLHDQIHHRGQFSVYLRMADAKVPAIYGPSLDEPWF